MAENIPTYSALTLDGIFKPGETYVVPPYQRGYAWTSEEVDQLIQDLLQAYSEKPGEHYLLGQAIVCKVGNDWEVVDGQQRLTTLYILLACAWQLIEDESQTFDFNTRTRFNTLAPMILNVDGHNVAVPRLSVAKSGRNFVDMLVKGEKFPPNNLDSTQENIRTAVEIINDAIRKNFVTAEEKFEFAWFAIKKIVLLRLELENTNHALRVFQKMNNRGLTLDDADLLKNLLFVKADENEFLRLSKSWDDATQALYKSRLKRLRSMEFLMKALIGIKSGKSIPSSQVFEEWEGRLENKDDANIFARSLENRATSIQHASHGKSPSGNPVTELPGTYLFKWVQHFEVLLAGDHLEETSFRHLCDIVENRAMLSMLAGEKNQDFERMLHKWSNKVSALPVTATRNEILTASTDALSGINGLITDMVREVPKLSYEVQTQRDKLRYCLARIAQAVEEQAKNFTPNNELLIKLIQPTPRGTKKYHIDHVFPKSDGKRDKWDDSEKVNLIHSIGNLVLLHPDDNQNQGDELPESLAKVTNLMNSKLLVNQVLCQRPEGQVLQPRVEAVFNLLQSQQPPVLELSDPGDSRARWGASSVTSRQALYLEILSQEFLSHLT